MEHVPNPREQAAHSPRTACRRGIASIQDERRQTAYTQQNKHSSRRPVRTFDHSVLGPKLSLRAASAFAVPPSPREYADEPLLAWQTIGKPPVLSLLKNHLSNHEGYPTPRLRISGTLGAPDVRAETTRSGPSIPPLTAAYSCQSSLVSARVDIPQRPYG